VSQLLTPEEAAKRLQVSHSTIKRWLRNGDLKGVKPGGKVWRVEEDALEQFITASANIPQSNPSSDGAKTEKGNK